MMFPKFWSESDFDWTMKFDNLGSYEVRSEMQRLVYCIVLEIGFHSKPTKWLLPSYYDVSQVLDAIRYRLVHDIGQFRFVRSSLWNGVVGVFHCFSHWISLKNSPNDSSHDIMMFPKFWTQSDIDWSVKLDNSGSYEVRSEMQWLVFCIVLEIGFHSKPT